jgi:hypothetical protein
MEITAPIPFSQQSASRRQGVLLSHLFNNEIPYASVSDI